MPHATEKTLFDQFVVRDTNTHRPLRLVPMKIARSRAFFPVINDLDQDITVEIILDSQNNPAGARTTGAQAVISANTRDSIATNLWGPWIGVEITAAGAPTSGEVTIEGITEAGE